MQMICSAQTVMKQKDCFFMKDAHIHANKLYFELCIKAKKPNVCFYDLLFGWLLLLTHCDCERIKANMTSFPVKTYKKK